MPVVEALTNAKSVLAESPLWCEQENALYWVDIKDPRIFRYGFEDSAIRVWTMPSEIGSICNARSGTLVAALRTGVMLFEPQTGRFSAVAHPESARPGYRLNESKIDPLGRLWVGSVEDPGFTAQGYLYCIDSAHNVVVKKRHIAMPNSLGWSPDARTMYFSDSLTRRIMAYDFDAASGEIANPRTFAEVPEREGFPDGLAVDVEGFVWNAQIDGWRIKRYDPDGHIERILPVPVRRPTSLAFGGKDYSILFITTAAFRLAPKELAAQPLAGCVLIHSPGVRGRKEPIFKMQTSGSEQSRVSR